MMIAAARCQYPNREVGGAPSARTNTLMTTSPDRCRKLSTLTPAAPDRPRQFLATDIGGGPRAWRLCPYRTVLS